MLNFLKSLPFGDIASLEQELLFRPYSHLDCLPSSVGLVYEDVQMVTVDQQRLHGWWLPVRGNSGEVSLRAQAEHVLQRRDPQAPAESLPPELPLHGFTLLYCHGNGGNISHRLDRVRLYHRLGLNVLLFDYRGYGRSEGTPTELGTYRDAEAAWRYLTDVQHIPASRIVLYGESLGCAVALETALHHPSRALVLESPFTSTVAMARRLFPQLPVDSLIRNRYDNLEKIGQLRVPVLIFHSPGDGTVPFAMGESLFREAPEPKQLFRLCGSHFLGYHETGAAYPEALRQFLMGPK